MISIQNKKDCCGCKACGDICAKNAITFVTDEEGFWYPQVDNSLCVNCGLCEQVCPQLHVAELKHNDFETPICFAATHKNIETRFASTTGGLFSALAEEMYRRGGYVGGAIYGENWVIQHFISNNTDDLQCLRQSKYAQSDTHGFYKEVKRLLANDEKVLICGTPCQMAAMRQYLGKDYPHLIIVDFICKSIGSPLFFAKYLDFWERKADSPLVSFKFKDKELGWRALTKKFDFKNGKSFYSRAQDNDLWSSAYHANIASRPSCYDCQFKGFPRLADITIADFWGCENYEQYRSLDDNAGTSAVICNSQKGLTYFESIRPYINSVEADIEHIKPHNPALIHAQKMPQGDRKSFFRDLHTLPIEEVVPKYCGYYQQKGEPNKTLKNRIKRILKACKLQWKISDRNLCCFCAFIKWNVFSKQIHTDWWNHGLIFVRHHAIIDIAKSANIILKAPFMVESYSIVDIHPHATMEIYGKTEIGKKARFPKSKLETRLLLDKNSEYINREDTHFGYGCDIEVHAGAKLLIDHCGTNANCTIICANKIEMRGNVSLGRDVSIRDTNAHLIALDGYKISRPVIIEDHTWLCSGATICPGVKVHSGAIVGAQSFVIQNVPAHSLVSGHPAKVVEKNIAWKI